MANYNQCRVTITAGQSLSRTPPGAHVNIRACAFRTSVFLYWGALCDVNIGLFFSMKRISENRRPTART